MFRNKQPKVEEKPNVSKPDITPQLPLEVDTVVGSNRFETNLLTWFRFIKFYFDPEIKFANDTMINEYYRSIIDYFSMDKLKEYYSKNGNFIFVDEFFDTVMENWNLIASFATNKMVISEDDSINTKKLTIYSQIHRGYSDMEDVKIDLVIYKIPSKINSVLENVDSELSNILESYIGNEKKNDSRYIDIKLYKIDNEEPKYSRTIPLNYNIFNKDDNDIFLVIIKNLVFDFIFDLFYEYMKDSILNYYPYDTFYAKSRQLLQSIYRSDYKIKLYEET